MKSTITFLLSLVIVLSISNVAFSQEKAADQCFFKSSSLHFTAGGMGYWYDKARGGLESITGVPYNDLGCKNCHIESCDVCHKAEQDGKLVYTNEAAAEQDKCLKCHAREASIMKINEKTGTPDVHHTAGLKCMDCHTAREMHGDGTKYVSMKQKGAMDANCEQCHDKIEKSISHIIHGSKLDCNACHVQQVVSCTNCHFETMVKEGKRVAIPVSGWSFLMNYNGKVTSANMQTFVAPGNKTFMIFAPQFSHSVSKEGKKCEDCHNTANDKEIENGAINLTWLDGGEVKQAKGTIPVVDGVLYNSVFQNYQSGNWTPIIDPVKPKVQYVGFGTPLSEKQFKKLLKPQKSKK